MTNISKDIDAAIESAIKAVSGHRYIVTGAAGSGKSASMLRVFEMLRGNGVQSVKPSEALIGDEEERLAQKPLDWLLEQYASRPQNVAPKRRSQEATTYDRDPIVVALRKRLADYLH